MPQFTSLGGLADHLRRVRKAYPERRRLLLWEIGRIVEREATVLIGTEYAAWPVLADRTLEDKERGGWLGRISATDPLYRTGELKASYTFHVTGNVVDIGTPDIVGLYHEVGTRNMPPRPVLVPAMFRTLKETSALLAHGLATIITGGPHV